MKNEMKIDWKKGGGLVPAVIQDVNTGAVLMLGYMNKEAFVKTKKTKKVWFYSRTRRRLWMKGEESGHVLRVAGMRVDCDHDTILVAAQPLGPTCHTGEYSCFGNDKPLDTVLSELYRVILDRKRKMPENSYTSFLFGKGAKKICAKIKEESGEVIKAANRETRKRLIEESVDLLYHLFVLLAFKNIRLEDIFLEARRRRK